MRSPKKLKGMEQIALKHLYSFYHINFMNFIEFNKFYCFHRICQEC